MRPTIGITSSYDASTDWFYSAKAYCLAVIISGGLPVIIPFCEHMDVTVLASTLDGIIFSGGGDLDPIWMGEEPQNGLGEISPERDKGELTLCKLALKKRIPLLGICRGVQVLAVAGGGRVYQDMQDLDKNILKHMQAAPKDYPTHNVFVTEGSKLFQIVKERQIRVNSFHHQSVAEVGEDFLISARSQDGIIEAIEYNHHPFAIGVQWHPEHMVKLRADQRTLFTSLVEEAVKYSKGGKTP